jgi:NAD(P)H dehydrogenase (quinone)
MRALWSSAIVLAFVSAIVFHVSSAFAADPAQVKVLVAYHSASGNTEKMAEGVAEGAKAVTGASVVLKRVADIAADDLLSADAVIVGSPVYFAGMSAEVKAFFDAWFQKYNLFRDAKMRDKVGGAFVTGGSISNGKEVTMLGILQAMLVNRMIVVGGGGVFGASATTGPDSPGIDEKELATARDLGKRVTEIATIVKRGSVKP